MFKKFIGVLALATMLPLSAHAAQEIGVTENSINISGAEYALQSIAFERHGEIYLPLDEVMVQCGFTLGWDEVLRGTVCDNGIDERAVILTGKNTHIIGYKMYRYENPVLFVGDVYYINEALLEDITGCEVSALSELGGMPGTVIGDDFRKSGEVVKYSPLFVQNREFVFEKVAIDPTNAGYYAAIVNDFARALPGVKVYNMLIPNPSEIYAPKEYYTAQVDIFEKIYEQLDDNVIPVRVADTLYEHADEYIYFNTDHHWTQRGAYYAWKAFMEVRGETVPELDEFPRADSGNFRGSYMGILKGLNALNSEKETIEKYLPIYDVKVDLYYDMNMQEFIYSVPLVSTSTNTYNCFISGDTPVAVISGGVKNGRKLAIIKESFGNALSTWAVNNFETVYVIDIRGFYDGSFDIKTFREITGFDELLIESYPTTIESSDLRIGLLSLLGNEG